MSAFVCHISTSMHAERKILKPDSMDWPFSVGDQQLRQVRTQVNTRSQLSLSSNSGFPIFPCLGTLIKYTRACTAV